MCAKRFNYYFHFLHRWQLLFCFFIIGDEYFYVSRVQGLPAEECSLCEIPKQITSYDANCRPSYEERMQRLSQHVLSRRKLRAVLTMAFKILTGLLYVDPKLVFIPQLAQYTPRWKPSPDERRIILKKELFRPWLISAYVNSTRKWRKWPLRPRAQFGAW